MKTSPSHQGGKRGWGGKLLSKMLHPCARRAIFLSSLAAFLTDAKQADKELERKLASLFDLAYEPSTLRWPMQMHHRIWTDIDNPLNKEHLTFSDIMHFVRDVKRQMPYWLVYDIESAMSNDIFKLLKTQLRNRAL